MADLTGQKESVTYKQLLQIGTGNVGLTASLQTVQDGAGNNSVLQLSTTALNVQGTFSVNGHTLAVPITGASISGTSSGINTGDQTITLIGNVTGSGTGSFVTTIANSAVTYAKIQNVAATRLLGNPTGSPAAPSEISAGAGLLLSGTSITVQTSGITAGGDLSGTLDSVTVAKINGATLGTTTATSGHILVANGSSQWVSVAMSNDATIAAGGSLTIGSNKVTYAKMQQVSAHKVLGNTTGSTANVAEIATSTFMQTIAVQTFTSSGTYTPTSGMVYCLIKCIGSGAGGGGAANSTGFGEGGGGGSGGYSEKYATAATIGVSQTVTVGAAGTGGTAGNNAGTAGNAVSVGTICVANGGGAGGGAAGNNPGAAGTGATAGTGDIASVGNAGGQGSSGTITTVAAYTNFGAPSALGGMVPPAGNSFTSANVYGAGGSGGSSVASGGNVAGGNGAKGIVYIIEFIAS